jgi:hypothetical protein
LGKDKDGNLHRANLDMADKSQKPFPKNFGKPCWRIVNGTEMPVKGCPFIAKQRV